MIGSKKVHGDKVEVVRPRGRPKKTWREFVERDCWTWQL